MDIKKRLYFLIVLSIIIIGIFVYLTNLHYVSEETSFCEVSAGISCEIVNKSVYSELFGVPVAIFGILTFLLIILISSLAIRNKPFKILNKNITQKILLLKLLLLLIISSLFALYLVYAELFLILSICIMCVVSDLIILIALYTAITLNDKLNKKLLITLKIFSYIMALIVIYLFYKIISEVF